MASGSNRNLYFAASVACLTAALFGLSVGFIGGVIVLPSFQHNYGLDELPPQELAAAQGTTVTLWLLGALLGVPLGMPIYSNHGRRRCLALSAGLYVVGATLQLVQVHQLVIGTGPDNPKSHSIIQVFDTGRFLNGLGVGAGTLVSPMYISEISPPQVRGMLMSGYQTALQLSALCGFWAAYVTVNTFPDSSSLQFQIPVALQLIPGSLLVLGTFLIPEAPRFLAEKGRTEDLRKAIGWLRGTSVDDSDITDEVEDIYHAVEASERLQSIREGFGQEIRTRSLRQRLMVGVGLMIAQNMVGLNAINYYAPVIFVSAGFTSVSASLFLTGLYGGVKLISAIAFMFVFVKMRGNRFWLKLGSAVCGISMLVLAFCIWQLPTPDKSAPSRTTVEGVIAVLAVFVFSFAFSVSLGPISWNVCGEIFPAHINAKCCAITTATQWLFQMVIAGITPRLIASIGWGTYLVYAGFCFATLIWTSLVVPETRGVPLGAPMDKLFDIDAKDDINGNFEEIEDVEVSETTALLHRERMHRRSSVALAL